MDLPVFEPMPMPVPGNWAKKRKLITGATEQYLVDHYNSMTNKGLAKHIGCSVDTVVLAMRRMRLKRKKFFKCISVEDLGLLLEEYFCTNCTVVYLAAKYNTSVTQASKYISYMIPLKLNEDREVVVKESKV